MDPSEAATPAPSSGRGVPPEWAEAVRAAVASPLRAVAAAGTLALVAATGFFLLRGGTGPPPRLELPRIGSQDPAPTPGATGPGAGPTAPDTTSSTAGLTVHVAGAVIHPGVYVLPPGSRVADAIAAAGGTRPQAALERVNLAATVTDGQRAWIPDRDDPPGAGDPAEGAAGPASPPTTRGPVDVNTAGLAELDQLPGVGPATAQAIVSYRERSGPFRSVAQLLEVPGIGPAKLETLRPLVKV